MVAVDLLNNEGKAITGIFKLHVLLLETRETTFLHVPRAQRWLLPVSHSLCCKVMSSLFPKKGVSPDMTHGPAPLEGWPRPYTPARDWLSHRLGRLTAARPQGSARHGAWESWPVSASSLAGGPTEAPHSARPPVLWAPGKTIRHNRQRSTDSLILSAAHRLRHLGLLQTRGSSACNLSREEARICI